MSKTLVGGPLDNEEPFDYAKAVAEYRRKHSSLTSSIAGLFRKSLSLGGRN